MHGDVLRQIQELCCLRVFVVSSDPRSAPKTAKKPFFLKSHLSRWLLSLGRGSQLDTELKKVDTELTLDDFALGPSRWWLLALALPGWDTTYIIVIIARRKLTLSLQKNATACAVGPFDWALELRTEWPTHSAWTPQMLYTRLRCSVAARLPSAVAHVALNVAAAACENGARCPATCTAVANPLRTILASPQGVAPPLPGGLPICASLY